MAVVSMDLRGSGASFGTHKGPWLEEESEDSVELMNWVRIHLPLSSTALNDCTICLT